MTYLGRYLNGEYKQVWDDLFHLGTKVRQEPFHTDALAVAHETMRRVRKNIEVLIAKLVQIGFVFGYDHRIQPSTGTLHPAEDRKTYLENFLWARQQPPVFLSARQREEEKDEQGDILTFSFFLDALDEEYKLEQNIDLSTEKVNAEPQTMAAYIDEIEQLIGFVPLSLRAWYEEVGGVNFYGHRREWYELFQFSRPRTETESVPPTLMSFWDPLMVYPLDKAFTDQLHQKCVPGKNCLFEFAPDRSFKDNYGGAGSPYSATLPDPNMDFPLGSNLGMFVHYLRVAILLWAGFPGMSDGFKIPKKELDFLTRDLLPF